LQDAAAGASGKLLSPHQETLNFAYTYLFIYIFHFGTVGSKSRRFIGNIFAVAWCLTIKPFTVYNHGMPLNRIKTYPSSRLSPHFWPAFPPLSTAFHHSLPLISTAFPESVKRNAEN